MRQPAYINPLKGITTIIITFTFVLTDARFRAGGEGFADEGGYHEFKNDETGFLIGDAFGKVMKELVRTRLSLAGHISSAPGARLIRAETMADWEARIFSWPKGWN